MAAPQGPVSCVGVSVSAGSVYEMRWSASASHLLENLAFHDTKNRDLGKVALDVEATGGALSASAGRERMFHSYTVPRTYLPQAVEVLLDCVRNPAFLRRQLADAQEDLSLLENHPELFLQETVHCVGYSGGLGNPLFPTEEALGRIDRSAIRKFYFLHQA